MTSCVLADGAAVHIKSTMGRRIRTGHTIALYGNTTAKAIRCVFTNRTILLNGAPVHIKGGTPVNIHTAAVAGAINRTDYSIATNCAAVHIADAVSHTDTAAISRDFTAPDIGNKVAARAHVYSVISETENTCHTVTVIIKGRRTVFLLLRHIHVHAVVKIPVCSSYYTTTHTRRDGENLVVLCAFKYDGRIVGIGVNILRCFCKLNCISVQTEFDITGRFPCFCHRHITGQVIGTFDRQAIFGVPRLPRLRFIMRMLRISDGIITADTVILMLLRIRGGNKSGRHVCRRDGDCPWGQYCGRQQQRHQRAHDPFLHSFDLLKPLRAGRPRPRGSCCVRRAHRPRTDL